MLDLLQPRCIGDTSSNIFKRVAAFAATLRRNVLVLTEEGAGLRPGLGEENNNNTNNPHKQSTVNTRTPAKHSHTAETRLLLIALQNAELKVYVLCWAAFLTIRICANNNFFVNLPSITTTTLIPSRSSVREEKQQHQNNNIITTTTAVRTIFQSCNFR